MRKHLLKFIVIFLSVTACVNRETSVPTSTSTTAPSPDAHFPQVATPIGNVDFLVTGELVLENGCLRVSKANLATGDNFLLIWDKNFATRREQGVLQVIDAHTSEVLASVDDYVEIGGGMAPTEIEKYLKEPIPIECPGPYWLVGEPLKRIDKP